MRRILFSILFLLPFSNLHAADSKIAWQGWSEQVFKRAGRENRLVILDLEAVWCHWCHVMDEKTYSQAGVIQVIAEKYIPLRVDQDSRPDLANRYRDYGWPATIVFDPKGRELAKLAGYVEAGEMEELLKSLARDPRPIAETVSVEAPLADFQTLGLELSAELQRRHREAFDPELGGLRLKKKFLDADSLEYAMDLSAKGDAEETRRARFTLKAARALLDPAWGGVYQYSHGGNWANPHFEKIMAFQRDNLKAYSRAYARWKDPEHRRVADSIYGYLRKFLRDPNGAFYVSQDADLVPGEHASEYYALGDAERRRIGMPRIDRHLYSRENAWAVEALVEYYLATGETAALDDARRAANWVLANRRLANNAYDGMTWALRLGGSAQGGFSHDAEDEGGPFLGDTLAMGTAALKLYAATGERQWLQVAEDAANFIQRNFQAQGGGYFTTRSEGLLGPVRVLEDNIAMARFLNLLGQYVGDPSYSDGARHAMSWLAKSEVATARISEAGVLIAAEEMAKAPLHLTVVGPKSDPQARELFQAASRYPETYLRVEWWDRSEGPLANSDVQYPELKQSAAFVCTAKLCSSPVFQARALNSLIEKLSPRAGVAADLPAGTFSAEGRVDRRIARGAGGVGSGVN